MKALVLILLFAYLIHCFLTNFDVLKNMDKNHGYRATQNCRSMGTTLTEYPSVEDFRLTSENLLILGSGDVLKYCGLNDVAGLGKLAVMDLETEQIRDLPLENFPSDKLAFRPHGIEYSSSTNLLYVVNHNSKGDERVDIFKVTYPDSFRSMRVTYVKGMSTPPGIAINSVAEASHSGNGEFYVTNWVAQPVPTDGKSPYLPPLERPFWLPLVLIKWLGLPHGLFGSTGVYHCIPDAGDCARVASGYLMANGVTTSPDKSLVFVVDTAHKALVVYKVLQEEQQGKSSHAHPKLRMIRTFETPHSGDNIQLGRVLDSYTNPASGEQTFELWIGSIPKFFEYQLNSILHRGQHFGAFTQAIYDPKRQDVSFVDLAVHNGTILHSVATGVRFKGKNIMGGPGPFGGLLVCE